MEHINAQDILRNGGHIKSIVIGGIHPVPRESHTDFTYSSSCPSPVHKFLSPSTYSNVQRIFPPSSWEVGTARWSSRHTGQASQGTSPGFFLTTFFWGRRKRCSAHNHMGLLFNCETAGAQDTVPGNCCCFSFRCPATISASVAPAPAVCLLATICSDQHAWSNDFCTLALPPPEHPTQATVLQPSYSWQLCSRSERGGGVVGGMEVAICLLSFCIVHCDWEG